jgi:hypothetical protein
MRWEEGGYVDRTEMGQDNAQRWTFRIVVLDFWVPITHYIDSHDDFYSQLKGVHKQLYYRQHETQV